MEKFKDLFKSKEKRVENLVFFLVVLIVTLLVINKILEKDENISNFENKTNVELASNIDEKNSDNTMSLEKKLENILAKISGVGNVSVLITYSESSSLVPVYNVNLSTSTVEEKDTSGGVRTTETENNQKEVVTDGDSKVVTEKTIMPKVEGAIVTAQGASNPTVKTNIISAIEAVTGIATHKIQVFEMGD